MQTVQLVMCELSQDYSLLELVIFRRLENSITVLSLKFKLSIQMQYFSYDVWEVNFCQHS